MKTQYTDNKMFWNSSLKIYDHKINEHTKKKEVKTHTNYNSTNLEEQDINIILPR